MFYSGPLASLLKSGLQPASHLPAAGGYALANAWQLSQLVGLLCELGSQGASAATTMAMRLVLEAQIQGEPAAWVACRRSCFYPPDARDNGIDLEALAIVRVPAAPDIGRAADYLIRSGAFGLVVLDLGAAARLTERQLTRLLGLARQHGTAVVCLTTKPETAPSLGSVVSLRGQVHRERVGPGTFACELRVIKDKRRPPGWRHGEVCHGPAGLR